QHAPNGDSSMSARSRRLELYHTSGDSDIRGSAELLRFDRPRVGPSARNEVRLQLTRPIRRKVFLGALARLCVHRGRHDVQNLPGELVRTLHLPPRGFAHVLVRSGEGRSLATPTAP